MTARVQSCSYEVEEAKHRNLLNLPQVLMRKSWCCGVFGTFKESEGSGSAHSAWMSNPAVSQVSVHRMRFMRLVVTTADPTCVISPIAFVTQKMVKPSSRERPHASGRSRVRSVTRPQSKAPSFKT